MGLESSSSMRPGSNTEGIRPAEAKMARNIPAVKRNAAIAACTWRTNFCISWARLVLPNKDMVARAPWTTSTRRMKRKNRINNVEQARNPQKILREKASRKVSFTKATVTLQDLLFMNHLHEDLFERARCACDSFDLAMFGAQQIDGLVGFFAIGENKLDVSVALGDGAGPSAQRVLYLVGHGGCF